MPRYYFDLVDGDTRAVDEEGLELKDLRAVQAEAAKSLADMAREALDSTTTMASHYMAIEVRADTGPVMQVKFTFEVEKVMH
jgi:hypothetical protein